MQIHQKLSSPFNSNINTARSTVMGGSVTGGSVTARVPSGNGNSTIMKLFDQSTNIQSNNVFNKFPS
jgi:hypothetical protein